MTFPLETEGSTDLRRSSRQEARERNMLELAGDRNLGQSPRHFTPSVVSKN